MSGVLKLPSSAVALWGASSLLVQVTVPPTEIVTDAGENEKLIIATLPELDLRAFAEETTAPPPEEAVAGDPGPSWVAVSPLLGAAWLGPPPFAPSEVASGVVAVCAGPAGVVAVVVVPEAGAVP